MAKNEESVPTEAEVTYDDKSANLPGSVPDEMKRLAEDLPEKDPVQKAYKQALTADDSQAEAKAYAKVVDESPNAAETPSGAALKKVAGVSNDTERGERYAREKQAHRWGTVPVDE